VTDEIYCGLFTDENTTGSIHTSRWPDSSLDLIDERAEALGEQLVAIASAVRRYKSERNLALGTVLTRLQLAATDPKMAGWPELRDWIEQARPDLMSITRAGAIEIKSQLDPGSEIFQVNDSLYLQIDA
jgi:valyl-tRNA synthetase